MSFVSNGSDYYDIDAILAEEELTPCTFMVEAFNLGFLDNCNTEKPNLEEGTKLALPFWVTEALAIREYVQLGVPLYFSPRFRSHLLADPVVMNLRERSPYYYETGIRVSHHLPDRDAITIIPTLIRALSARYRDILDKSQNSRNEDLTHFTESLTQLEKHLFDKGYQGSNDLFRWKMRDLERLTSYRPTKRRRRA